MKKMINYFVQGLLYIAPLGITAYLIYVIFHFADGLTKELLVRFFDVKVPGLGILVLILSLMLIGFLGSTIVARPIRKSLKKIIQRIPVLNFVISALNDLLSAFVGKEKKFSKPVLVKVNLNSDLEKLGFVTEENLDVLGESDKVAVYFPHSYNFSGELFIVPNSHIRPVHLNSSEVMRFIVSAGLTGWSKESAVEDRK